MELTIERTRAKIEDARLDKFVGEHAIVAGVTA
eukprot:SAG31_NODE_359_length_17032_cov_11.017894_13_plen_33_part_00